MKIKPKFSFIWIILGLLIRLVLSQIGYNHDVTAYYHVGEIVQDGQVIYAATNKFNYGFIMAYVFGACFWLNKTIGCGSIQGMHALVCLICAIFDVLIALQLNKRFGTKLAFLFLFHPISLLITGYHTQFDTIAIYLGLKCWFCLEDNKPIKQAILWLAVSLIVKHVFLLFLPWLLFYKKYNLKERIALFASPLLLFLISFGPFMIEASARAGVFAHVFSYNSFEQHSLLGILCQQIPYFDAINANIFGGKLLKYIFMLSIAVLGYFSMRKLNSKAIYIYLWALVALSSGMTDQYLAITCVTTVVFYRKPILRIFVLIATAYLIFDSRNNLSGSIHSLQYFSNNSVFVATLLSVATCQLLLFLALFKELTWPSETNHAPPP